MTLAGQFVIGDVFGLTLSNFQGEEIKSNLLSSFNQDTFNSVAQSFTNQTQINDIIDVATAFLTAARIFGELLFILTVTYIFMIIYYLLGGDLVGNLDTTDLIAGFIASGMTIPYVLLLGNTIIAKIRGI